METSTRPTDIAALRKDYMQRGLTREELDPSPFRQFERWFKDVVESRMVAEPNAMVLSTVSPEGLPRARFVLLKALSDAGFGFFTNLQSTKAQDLAGNPRAALTFGWIELERQVCIQGRVKAAPRAEVEAYFASRPRGSRLGAWASAQSSTITDREVLTRALADAEARFPGDVPTPPTWGGYVLEPASIEFWQGRTNRLHDRLRYRRETRGWVIERLSP